MISEDTRRQLEGLRLAAGPLLICDVDEVVLHFTREFEDFLATQGVVACDRELCPQWQHPAA